MYKSDDNSYYTFSENQAEERKYQKNEIGIDRFPSFDS